MMTFDDIAAKYGKQLKHWVDYFAGPLKAWQKVHGSKPTAGMLIAAVAMTNKHKRPGRECLSTAMQFRAEGSTVVAYQNIATVGFNELVGPANNKRKALVLAKHVTETVTGKPYNYQLKLTPAGEKFMLGVLDSVVAAATPATAQPAKAAPAAKAKPVKAKAPKKAKAKPVATPVSEPLTAADNAAAEPAAAPVTAEQPTSEALSALQAHFSN